MENENNDYYEPTIKTIRKPFIHAETGAKIGEEIITTYKICTDDCISKKQLISFLEDKIKECEQYISLYNKGFMSVDVERIIYKKKTYKEVLNFINKGGKDE